MNTASQPDTPSEWSKFSPLPPRLRSHVALENSETTAAADPSSTGALPSARVPAGVVASLQDAESPNDSRSPNSSTSPNGSTNPIANANTADTSADFDAPVFLANAVEGVADSLDCHNRKCEERRERRSLPPRRLFTANWRPMKIGKRRALVLELTVRCPECGFEHHATLVPPEWKDEG